MKKTITALAIALFSIGALAGPAQAAAPTDLGDVRYATTLAKAAWLDLSYSSQDSLCEGWYVIPKWSRNMMARTIREALDYDISVYDSRRAAYRLFNWAC